MTNIPYLLDSTLPTIRYLALTRLLDRPADDAEVQAAFQAIQSAGPAPEILAGQSPRGSWSGENSFYTPKYRSTHWSMMLLAELHASGESVWRGADFMANAGRKAAAHDRNDSKPNWQCFYGNIVRYAAQAGLADDERIHAVVDYLIFSALEGGWRCPHNADKPCAWGAARALWGLAAIRAAGMPGVTAAIDCGVDFLLADNALVQAGYPGETSPFWFKLNFPLFYQADILFVLRVLGELGRLSHPGAQQALGWLESKREKQGTFRGTSPFRSRTYAAVGSVAETNRWVTLQAEMIFKTAGRN